MKIVLRWYELTAHGETDYSKEHERLIDGSTAAECMKKRLLFSYNHDLSKNTKTEIVSVLD